MAARASASPSPGLQRRLAQAVEIGEMAREQFAPGFADMADAKREDEAVERHFAALVDRIEQVCARFWRPQPSRDSSRSREFVLRASRVKMSCGALTSPSS